MRLLALLLLIAVSCGAVTPTTIAAYTTIVVNVLEIRSNIQRVRAGTKAVKKAGRVVGRTIKKAVK